MEHINTEYEQESFIYQKWELTEHYETSFFKVFSPPQGWQFEGITSSSSPAYRH